MSCDIWSRVYICIMLSVIDVDGSIHTTGVRSLPDEVISNSPGEKEDGKRKVVGERIHF